uniref:Uncharacterized protein n=1 Tax=Solanum lycopersicum TaxID=4081 RepID=K4BYT5_SOLLC
MVSFIIFYEATMSCFNTWRFKIA